MKILERLRAGAGRALQDGPVLFAYLFGSRASGRAGERSDVDVAVFLDDSVPPERYLDVKLELPGRLEATTGIDGIEVLVLNDAPLMLAGRAIRDRLLVYSRDDPVGSGSRERRSGSSSTSRSTRGRRRKPSS